MARRKGRKGKGRKQAFTVDLTEGKLAMILLNQYGVPQAAGKAMNKDLSGAMTELGKGDVVSVLTNSTIAGAGGAIRRKLGLYLQPIKSSWFKLKV